MSRVQSVDEERRRLSATWLQAAVFVVVAIALAFLPQKSPVEGDDSLCPPPVVSAFRNPGSVDYTHADKDTSERTKFERSVKTSACRSFAAPRMAFAAAAAATGAVLALSRRR